ncbi:MAG: hypothetical protein K2Y05_09015 [Hyphomicrobiaceae bacterium]|nr:hypothetical protein [Hyphomicrobiaceae bacterium]
MAVTLAMPSPVEAAATEWTVGKAETRARMISGDAPTGGEAFGAKPGSVMAAVEIELAKGWKTYWRFPGDAGGVPPMFDWSKSENVKSARVLYPVPERITDKAGDILGYQGRATLPVVIEPLDAAKPISLALKFDYGVCREVCIPVEAEFTAAVPVSGRDVLPGTVTAALDRVPRAVANRRPDDPKLLRTKVRLDGDKPTLTVEGEFPGSAAKADVYVESPDGYYIPLTKPGSATSLGGNIVRFEIGLAGAVEPAQIRGKAGLVTLVSERGRSEASIKFE